MTTDYRAAVDELLNALCKVQDWDGTRVGDAMDAVERATLTQPEPEHRPTWTEGVCGEGAAILNAAALAQIEVMAQIVYENAMLATAPEHAKPHWPSWNDLPNSDARIHSLNTAEIILARWGRPAIQPVPVAERLPEPEDCASWPDEPDSVPWAWAGKCVDGVWEWTQLSMYGLGLDTLSRIIAGGGWTHWLPHHTLPIPQPTPGS